MQPMCTHNLTQAQDPGLIQSRISLASTRKVWYNYVDHRRSSVQQDFVLLVWNLFLSIVVVVVVFLCSKLLGRCSVFILLFWISCGVIYNLNFSISNQPNSLSSFVFLFPYWLWNRTLNTMIWMQLYCKWYRQSLFVKRVTKTNSM